MKPITTLLDRDNTPEHAVLPEELALLYNGDLRFLSHDDRPYVIGNFVSTLDGVVSFEIPGKSGGGDISGLNEADRFIMGLLRAGADAAIVGSHTLREVAPGHLWLAEHVYPEARGDYAQYRRQLLHKPQPPLNVIVSGSGAIDLQRAVFRTPNVHALILTSTRGGELLERNGVAALPSTEVRKMETNDGRIAPASILKLLHDEFAVKLLLHEGGPTLFGDFIMHGCVDELFLTVAPQIAGRDLKRQRPGVVARAAFLPETAPWLNIISVKQSGDHLYLRYNFAEPSKRSR
jgi:riboflavin biosynthesis pyrimidine reductase